MRHGGVGFCDETQRFRNARGLKGIVRIGRQQLTQLHFDFLQTPGAYCEAIFHLTKPGALTGRKTLLAPLLARPNTPSAAAPDR